jgi:hypothetical protein
MIDFVTEKPYIPYQYIDFLLKIWNLIFFLINLLLYFYLKLL